MKLTITQTHSHPFSNNEYTLQIEGLTLGKLMALNCILDTATPYGPVEQELMVFLKANLASKMREHTLTPEQIAAL